MHKMHIFLKFYTIFTFSLRFYAVAAPFFYTETVIFLLLGLHLGHNFLPGPFKAFSLLLLSPSILICHRKN